MEDDKTAFIIVWCCEGAFATVLHACGIYLLVTQKRKSISHFLLIHLSCIEVFFVVFDITYHTRAVLLTNKLSFPADYKWKSSVTLVCFVAQYMAVTLLTLDRVLAIKLTFRYHVIITKAKLVAVLLLTWCICLMHIAYYLLTRKHHIYMFWHSFLALVIIVSYAYIIISAKMSHKKAHEDEERVPRQKIKYKVPLLITGTIVCFYFIPEILLVAGVKKTVWFYVVWYLNYLFDPAIYIFCSYRIRNRLIKYWFPRRRLNRALTIEVNSDDNEVTTKSVRRDRTQTGASDRTTTTYLDVNKLDVLSISSATTDVSHFSSSTRAV